ncbi:autotransporter domain-containing protein [Sutterella wadsworthensis]|uniref:autotransporter domain-containing protein n=1 Tax=Sutterella wadsworthensis TaxID=40545 RepID=UPI003FF0DF5C
MNRTFKVAKSLTRGVVVTSEKASSYQGKAVKTVIAAAVASLVAGTAMAADNEVKDLTLNGTTLTITGSTAADMKVADEAKTIIDPKVTEGTTDRTTWKNGTDIFGYKGMLTLNQGELVVEGHTKTIQGAVKVKDTGTISLAATKTKDGVLKLGDPAVNEEYKLGADGDLVVNFKAEASSEKTVQLLGRQETFTFGAVQKKTGDIITEPAHAVVLNVAKDVKAEIGFDSSAGLQNTTLKLDNIALNNAGQLTFKAQTIQINSDIAAQEGTTIYEGASNISNAEVAGKNVLVSNADNTDYKQDTKFIGSVAVAEKGVLSAETLDVKGTGSLTSSGTGLVKATTINLESGSTVTLGGTTEATTLNVLNGKTTAQGGSDLTGKATLTNLVIDNSSLATGVTAAATSFTASNATLKVADAITVKGNTADAGSTLTLTRGKTSAGTVTVGAFGTLTVTQQSQFAANTLDVTGAAAANTTATATFTNTNITADAITVGKNGSLTLDNSDSDVGTVNVAGTMRVTSTGNDSYLGADSIAVANNGSLTLAGEVEFSTLTIAGKTASTATDAGSVVLGDGYYVTTSDQLFKAVENKTGIEAIGALKDNLTTAAQSSQTYRLNDAAFNYTKAQYDKLAASHSSSHFEFVNGLLVGAKDSSGNDTVANFADAVGIGYVGKSAVAIYTDTAAATASVGTSNLTAGSIALKTNTNPDTKFASLTINADGNTPGTLTLRGDADGKVFYLPAVTTKDANGKDVTDVMPVTLNVATAFGEEEMNDTGVVDGKITANKAVTVNGDFTFAEDLTLAGTATDTTDDLSIYGRMSGKNIIVANNANAKAHIKGGVLVLEGTAPDAQQKEVGQQVTTGNVVIDKVHVSDGEEKGGLLVIGSANEAAAQAYQSAHHLDNTLWVSQAVNFKDGVTFGSNAATGTWNGVLAGGENTVAIDLAALGQSGYEASETAAVITFGSNVSPAAPQKLVLANLAQVNKSSLVYDKVNDLYYVNTGVGLANQGRVDFGTRFYTTDLLTAQSNGKVYLQVNEAKVEEVAELGLNSFGSFESSLYNVEFGKNIIADKLIFGLDDLEKSYLKSIYKQALAAGVIKADTTEAQFAQLAYADPADIIADGKMDAYSDFINAAQDAFDAQLVSAEHAATNMAALGGAFTTALDINDQVTAAVSRRTSAQRTEGFTPWVDVFGTTNEAKRLYGNGAGYEADIYGAVLGFDYTAACGGTLGVAFNVGQADGNSVGSGAKVDNDADFYGVSLYGAQTFGDFNVKADLGYTQVSNDLSTNNVLGSYKESLDANVFTFGLGTEYLAKFGALNVTPHAGIRLSRIDMDDSKYGADYDTMTVYQLPLGVAFSGNFDVNGWKLAPMVDLSVVPAFGDKDAVATYTGGIQSVTRVVDTNPIQATLGVSAQNGAWTFGLNYGLTAGGDDRMNNAFNANLRYSF